MTDTATPNLSSLDFWRRSADEREAGFRHLRDEEPLSWQPQPESSLLPDASAGTGGYFAAVRFEDIRAISRDTTTFVSGQGVMLEDAPQEFLDAAQSFLIMDGAQHKSLRGLVGQAFTPKQITHLETGIRSDVATILDDLEDHESGDFVELVAKRLPLMTIARMLGVPEDQRDELVHQADAMVSWNDPAYLQGREPIEVIGGAIMALHGACYELCAARRENPGDDLLSALVQAEFEGERLEDAQIASFFTLLSVAGNDTTRHTTTHAMLALSEHEDQLRLLQEDPAGRVDDAIEEFVRWASPVMTFRRTAVQDTELHGRRIEAGQKVVLFYPSGNRDERNIDDPQRFDVTRRPNRHLGFGGGGAHYCLGAPLAKLQLRVLFTELLGRYPELRVADPTPLVGTFVNGISHIDLHRGAAA